MKKNLAALEKALEKLRTIMSRLESDEAKRDPALREVFSTAAVKSFEYNFALSVSVIYEALYDRYPNREDIDELEFLDKMRKASKAKIIDNPCRFEDYRQLRNDTAHNYNDELPEKAMSLMSKFVDDIKFIVNSLK